MIDFEKFYNDRRLRSGGLPQLGVDVVKVINDYINLFVRDFVNADSEVEPIKSDNGEITINLTTKQIIDEACFLYRISFNSLVEKGRKREFVVIRQMICKVAKDHTSDSLAKIGLELGGRDHATVLHGIKTFNTLIDKVYGTSVKYFEYRKFLKHLNDVSIKLNTN